MIAAFILFVTVEFLMSDQLVESLEYQQALAALVVHTWSALVAVATFTFRIPTVNQRLILKYLACFLSGILKPNDNHTRTEV